MQFPIYKSFQEEGIGHASEVIPLPLERQAKQNWKRDWIAYQDKKQFWRQEKFNSNQWFNINNDPLHVLLSPLESVCAFMDFLKITMGIFALIQLLQSLVPLLFYGGCLLFAIYFSWFEVHVYYFHIEQPFFSDILKNLDEYKWEAPIFSWPGLFVQFPSCVEGNATIGLCLLGLVKMSVLLKILKNLNKEKEVKHVAVKLKETNVMENICVVFRKEL